MLPQHHTAPVPVSAHVACRPATTCTAPLTPATLAGAVRHRSPFKHAVLPEYVDGTPISPHTSRPQHHTSPALSTAQEARKLEASTTTLPQTPLRHE